jgi:hypothetical protein
MQRTETSPKSSDGYEMFHFGEQKHHWKFPLPSEKCIIAHVLTQARNSLVQIHPGCGAEFSDWSFLQCTLANTSCVLYKVCQHKESQTNHFKLFSSINV